MQSEKRKEPPSSQTNQGEVAEQNKHAAAKAPASNAPVDGSNNERHKRPASADDVQLDGSKVAFSWRKIGTWDFSSSTDTLQTIRTGKAIETYVIDHFYGDWYWNTALPIGVSFFAYAFARVGLSVLWLLVVFLAAFSVYRAEFRRFNRDVRDDMRRINSSNRLENELETMEWLNSFLAKFWVIYMPALSEMVLFQANEVMKDQAPGFGIEAISLDEFTLGSKAPRVDSIKSYTRKGKDHIEMDWAFSFAPNDTDDMTKNEIKKKINPKVALGVTVGKAFISKSLPILVEDMSFTGRMNIKLKLTDNFPHVKMVSVQFLEPPVIDYALKPVGGDTFGIDIMSFIPGLSSFVNGLIHSNLRPMLYAPNSLDIDVEEIMAQQSNDSIGALAVKIKRISKLRSAAELKDNVFNPYVELKISNNADISEKTAVKKNTTDPVFLETKFLLVNALENNHLSLQIFHYVPDKPDDIPLGVVDVPLVDLLQEETQMGVTKNIFESGKIVGKIEFDMRWFGALKAEVLEDGTKEENIDSETGIMKLSVLGAHDLDITKAATGFLNPYAEVYVNDELIKTSRRLRNTNEPAFGVNFESLVTSQSKTSIQVIVKDAVEDAIVGKLEANLQDLVFESSRGQQWISAPPTNDGGRVAQFRIGAKWKALALSDEDIEMHRDAPIGGLRVHLRRAAGLANLEAVGAVDPYVKIVQSGKLKAKTPTIANTCDPYFNQVFFLPVANEHQHVLLDIYDAEPEGKDRALGSCAISIKNFLKKNAEGYYLAYDGAEEVIEQPVLFGGKNVGAMTYSVSFVPTLPAYTRAQLENLDALKEEQAKAAKDEEKRRRKEQEKYDKHPDQYEWVELLEDTLPQPEKLKIPLEAAIKYRSGTLLVSILSGTFSKPDYYVHTLLDDHASPSNVTPRAETRRLTTPTVAEAFIRDLPNSKLVFRISKKREVEDQKDVVAEHVYSTLEILEKAYHKPLELRIKDKNSIRVQLEFIPSAVKLAPLDTVLDVGKVQLDILGAHNLPAADSNGKSDPLCAVKLDGVEVHKTDKKRRTLDPVWNDSVVFPMLSRSRQILMLEVYDWDLTHKDELLGRARLDLSTMPPNSSTPFKIDLDTSGTLSCRVTFKPEYIRPVLSKSRGLQIDLHDVTGAPLKVVGGAAGLAENAVGSGFGLVSDTVTKGGSFLKGFGKKKKEGSGGASGASGASVSGSGRGSESRTSQASRAEEESDAEADDADATASDDASDNNSDNDSDSRQGAPPVEEQMEQNKPPELENTLPNMQPELLPPPQKPTGHRRVASESTDVSSFTSSTLGADAVAGRVNIVCVSGLGKSVPLHVKTALVTPAKTKDVYKTRSSKADAQGTTSWNESFVFKAPASGTLSFAVRETHHFGKSQLLATAEVPLAEHSAGDEVFTVPVGAGTMTLSLHFVAPMNN